MWSIRPLSFTLPFFLCACATHPAPSCPPGPLVELNKAERVAAVQPQSPAPSQAALPATSAPVVELAKPPAPLPEAVKPAPVVATDKQGDHVKLYFPNALLAKQKGGDACARVFAVDRTLPHTPAIATETIKALLSGPTDDEKVKGFTTAIASGAVLEEVKPGRRGDIFEVRFGEGLRSTPSDDECAGKQLKRQIVATSLQFPSVRGVSIISQGKLWK